MLPSVGDGLAMRAREINEGLECTRSARLGPSGVGRPSVVGRREGLISPEIISWAVVKMLKISQDL